MVTTNFVQEGWKIQSIFYRSVVKVFRFGRVYDLMQSFKDKIKWALMIG